MCNTMIKDCQNKLSSVKMLTVKMKMTILMILNGQTFGTMMTMKLMTVMKQTVPTLKVKCKNFGQK